MSAKENIVCPKYPNFDYIMRTDHKKGHEDVTHNLVLYQVQHHRPMQNFIFKRFFDKNGNTCPQIHWSFDLHKQSFI